MSERRKKKKKKIRVGRIIGRFFLVIVTTLVMAVALLYTTMWIFCHGPSVTARNLFVSTMMETGALKFVPRLYFSKDEITQITGNNNMVHNDAQVDTNLINIASDEEGEEDGTDAQGEVSEQEEELFTYNENGIALIELTGRSYLGKLLIIKDPSRISLSTIYPWDDFSKTKYGITLDQLVQQVGGIAGINGGEYYSDGNYGGVPKGLVVSNGQILYNSPEYGDVMIGFNTNNILVIQDIGNMSASQVQELVVSEGIRDAVSFKDVDDGDTNHFAKLIINGQATQINGNGSGANPRTAIGQRADGAVLMFVTDGRGASSHIGATAADLISVMQEYGAINAANLDGGSSSSMYYNGKFEMTSTTLYYATSSWKLPDAFVVK